MKVAFRQIYIEPGVNFPFSVHFQCRLSEEVTSLVQPSARFIRNYGSDFVLIFNVSAKEHLKANEIKGPTVSKRYKFVDYTVFLPFRVIIHQPDPPNAALKFLLKGVRDVFNMLEIDGAELANRQESLIEQICRDLSMLRRPPWDDNENTKLVRTRFTASFESKQNGRRAPQEGTDKPEKGSG
jgi:hypothetical protein